eukprot:767669-Hanusia_phi.AAC.3
MSVNSLPPPSQLLHLTNLRLCTQSHAARVKELPWVPPLVGPGSELWRGRAGADCRLLLPWQQPAAGSCRRMSGWKGDGGDDGFRAIKVVANAFSPVAQLKQTSVKENLTEQTSEDGRSRADGSEH